MSSSTVTYTSISSDSDLPPWGFHLISNAEPQSPKAAVQSPEQAPLSPDYPLPVDASSTALSPGYVADSDLEEDHEEDPADYPADERDEE
nr:hypothetical protein [Tanacetum cinerariifolium]